MGKFSLFPRRASLYCDIYAPFLLIFLSTVVQEFERNRGVLYDSLKIDLPDSRTEIRLCCIFHLQYLVFWLFLVFCVFHKNLKMTTFLKGRSKTV